MNHKIKFYRKRALMSQTELAQKMGVSQGAVSHWETGDNRPQTDLIPKLAKIFGCSINELYDETA